MFLGYPQAAREIPDVLLGKQLQIPVRHEQEQISSSFTKLW